MKNKTIKMMLSVLLMVLCAFTLTACDASGYLDSIMNDAIEIVKFAARLSLGLLLSCNRGGRK